jgi:hypothetical protein
MHAPDRGGEGAGDACTVTLKIYPLLNGRKEFAVRIVERERYISFAFAARLTA